MSADFFIDTNILVYSFDLTSAKKCKIARGLVSQALEKNNGVISFQVVQEFINFALKSKKRKMNMEQARCYFQKVLKPLCAVHSSVMLYNRAIAIREETKFSWYDSLILASAQEALCPVLYSEDMQHGRVVGDLRIVNPFLS